MILMMILHRDVILLLAFGKGYCDVISLLAFGKGHRDVIPLLAFRKRHRDVIHLLAFGTGTRLDVDIYRPLDIRHL